VRKPKPKDHGGIGITNDVALNVVAPGDLAHRNDRDREAHRGAGADRRLCDFRPVATPEQIEHLLAAIDCTAAMALREAGAVALAS
jgi:hypothetical protein